MTKTTNGEKPLRWNDNRRPHSTSPPPAARPSNEFTSQHQQEPRTGGGRENGKYKHPALAESVINISSGVEKSDSGMTTNRSRKPNDVTPVLMQQVSRRDLVSPERRAVDRGCRISTFPSKGKEEGGSRGRACRGAVETNGEERSSGDHRAWSGCMSDVVKDAAPQRSEVKVMTGMMVVNRSERDRDRDISSTRTVAKPGRTIDGKTEDGVRASDTRPNDNKRQTPVSGNVQEQNHISDWVPEAGLHTTHIVPSSRPRSLKQEDFTQEEMPRNYIRRSGTEKPGQGASSGGGGGGSGGTGSACLPLEVQQQKQPAHREENAQGAAKSKRKNKIRSERHEKKKINANAGDSARRVKAAIDRGGGASPKWERDRYAGSNMGRGRKFDSTAKAGSYYHHRAKSAIDTVEEASLKQERNWQVGSDGKHGEKIDSKAKAGGLSHRRAKTVIDTEEEAWPKQGRDRHAESDGERGRKVDENAKACGPSHRRAIPAIDTAGEAWSKRERHPNAETDGKRGEQVDDKVKVGSSHRGKSAIHTVDEVRLTRGRDQYTESDGESGGKVDGKAKAGGSRLRANAAIDMIEEAWPRRERDGYAESGGERGGKVDGNTKAGGSCHRRAAEASDTVEEARPRRERDRHVESNGKHGAKVDSKVKAGGSSHYRAAEAIDTVEEAWPKREHNRYAESGGERSGEVDVKAKAGGSSHYRTAEAIDTVEEAWPKREPDRYAESDGECGGKVNGKAKGNDPSHHRAAEATYMVEEARPKREHDRYAGSDGERGGKVDGNAEGGDFCHRLVAEAIHTVEEAWPKREWGRYAESDGERGGKVNGKAKVDGLSYHRAAEAIDTVEEARPKRERDRYAGSDGERGGKVDGKVKRGGSCHRLSAEAIHTVEEAWPKRERGRYAGSDWERGGKVNGKAKGDGPSHHRAAEAIDMVEEAWRKRKRDRYAGSDGERGGNVDGKAKGDVFSHRLAAEAIDTVEEAQLKRERDQPAESDGEGGGKVDGKTKGGGSCHHRAAEATDEIGEAWPKQERYRYAGSGGERGGKARGGSSSHRHASAAIDTAEEARPKRERGGKVDGKAKGGGSSHRRANAAIDTAEEARPKRERDRYAESDGERGGKVDGKTKGGGFSHRRANTAIDMAEEARPKRERDRYAESDGERGGKVDGKTKGGGSYRRANAAIDTAEEARPKRERDRYAESEAERGGKVDGKTKGGGFSHRRANAAIDTAEEARRKRERDRYAESEVERSGKVDGKTKGGGFSHRRANAAIDTAEEARPKRERNRYAGSGGERGGKIDGKGGGSSHRRAKAPTDTVEEVRPKHERDRYVELDGERSGKFDGKVKAGSSSHRRAAEVIGRVEEAPSKRERGRYAGSDWEHGGKVVSNTKAGGSSHRRAKATIDTVEEAWPKRERDRYTESDGERGGKISFNADAGDSSDHATTAVGRVEEMWSKQDRYAGSDAERSGKRSSTTKAGGSPHFAQTAIGRVEEALPKKKERNRYAGLSVARPLSMSLFSAGGGHSNKDMNGDPRDDDDADTDITGTATDAEFDVGETMSVSSIGSRQRKGPTKKRKSFQKVGGGNGNRSSAIGRRPLILTYVTHDQPTAIEEDVEASWAPAGREGMSGTSPAAAPGTMSKRYKRPRPQVQGGSSRAVVWGEPCAACGGESSTSGVKEEVNRMASATGNGGASFGSFPRGAEVVDGLEGPPRPGQYVFLRAAASEDVWRSLISEGEFAAPRPDGLSGSALTGERIRVWRGSSASRSSGDGSDVDTFAEADVVQLNPANGTHRVRFVHDGAVEDVLLMKPTETQGAHSVGQGCSGGVGGGGSVRWLQKRARPRNRDEVRRNAAGLCEGPAGEMRGLVGDEHDPPTQRRENWRWVMSRWRWERGERDGYVVGGDQPVGDGEGAADGKAHDGRSFEERLGVPSAGDGMFPPIGKVLAVERRLVSTGEKVSETERDTVPGRTKTAWDGLVSDVFLKVARLWYPQDTRSGMDMFIHGKAEVFEACRVAQESDSETLDHDVADGAGSRAEARPIAVCKRLDAGQPLDRHPRLEPIVSWVRGCEVRQLASVHPCLDGRLNPCSGKVVNNPYQPQAEFFLSHRYCLELDAYFPLANSRPPSAVFPSPGSAFEHPGTPSPRTGLSDEAGRCNHSPRSTKARLLNRSVSDGMCSLPPKWHPLKKRMSFDHSTGGESGGSRSGSPVFGWETAIARSVRQDSGSGTTNMGSVSTCAAALVAANGVASPPLLSNVAQWTAKMFLCHRCRHVLPVGNLRKCMGRGCDKRFCSPCAAGPRASGFPGDKSSRRSLARWPMDETRDAIAGAVGGGPECGEMEIVNGNGVEMSGNGSKLWIGPCCQGRCECRECTAGAERGLLAGWFARNGLPYLYMTTNSTQQPEPRGSQPSPLLPSEPKDGVVAMGEWSGWQSRNGMGALHPPAAIKRDCTRTVNPEDATSGVATQAPVCAAPVPTCDIAAEEEEGGLDDVIEEKRVEWCSSCSAPGIAGSLTRCYYCRGAVHTSECRRFEDLLSRKRLAEHGVGPSGHLAAAPRGEGAVGHGIAVCVQGRWRAGLVLGWSPVLRAHLVRYVDGVLEQGTIIAGGLDVMPWYGEWVLLPTVLEGDPVHIKHSGGVMGSQGGERRQHPRSARIAVQASDVCWPLVDIALRLFPSPLDAAHTSTEANSCSSSSRPSFKTRTLGPTPTSAKPAVKVLKGLLKQTWLASLASMERDGNGHNKMDGAQKYQPPSIAIPDCLRGKEHVTSGDEPWVCRSCMEAKLQRLQRRIRAQFNLPRDVEAETAVANPPPPPTAAAAAAAADVDAAAAADVDAAAAADVDAATAADVDAAAAADVDVDAAAAAVAAAAAANDDDEQRWRQSIAAARRARSNRRLRWLPTGNPGSSRPFAFEAGFVSDLSEAHRNGGPTATGGGTGSGLARPGKKRPRPPPVTRAFAHILGGLDSQRPTAFALPPDIVGLDRDMAAFLCEEGEGRGNGVGVGFGSDNTARGDETEIEVFGDDDEVDAGFRTVVMINGMATVTSPGARGAPVISELAAMQGASRDVQLETAGTGMVMDDVAAVEVPPEFFVVKEVDLESSARVRSLDSSKHLIGLRRSSSGAGGVRNASHPHRVFSDVAAAVMAEDGSGDGAAGADGTTTLQDVSRKDRLQRMDQRRIRREGQELAGAGLLNVDVLQSRRKKLRFGRSSVHAWGVFADEPIAAGDLVIEYRGEIIGNAVADKREKMYHDMQIGSDYMFRVDEDTVVDATFKGSLARFINHSCDPSCTTRIIAVDGSQKIVIYAERDVAMGEELSYDYMFPLESDENARVPCRCGSPKCRGFIN